MAFQGLVCRSAGTGGSLVQYVRSTNRSHYHDLQTISRVPLIRSSLAEAVWLEEKKKEMKRNQAVVRVVEPQWERISTFPVYISLTLT